MDYTLDEVIGMMKAYHELESAAKDFLFISASALRNKEHKVRSALATLKAIEAYKKLPPEVRSKIESDKTTNASKIAELEALCQKALG